MKKGIYKRKPKRKQFKKMQAKREKREIQTC